MNDKLRYVAALRLDTPSGPVDPADRERERFRHRVEDDAAARDAAVGVETRSRGQEPAREPVAGR